jgi:hypothetical protein
MRAQHFPPHVLTITPKPLSGLMLITLGTVQGALIFIERSASRRGKKEFNKTG